MGDVVNRAYSVVQAVARVAGVEVSKRHAIPEDIDTPTRATIDFVRPYTVTSAARVSALCDAVTYVVRNGVPGAIVECGVWRGGSMMAVARTLMHMQETDRELYLCDTFEGLVRPDHHELHRDGSSASELLDRALRAKDVDGWSAVPLDDVRSALDLVGYPGDRVHFVKGRVETTLPEQAPDTIALLRLDTDWYDSTLHELECLYARVSPGGILIVDDYGYWQGSKRAVDEFFSSLERAPFLMRVDDCARMAVVPG